MFPLTIINFDALGLKVNNLIFSLPYIDLLSLPPFSFEIVIFPRPWRLIAETARMPPLLKLAPNAQENYLTILQRKKCMLLRRFHGNLLNQTVSTVTDPIVHAGRHFGRTVNAVIPTRTLVTNGLRRMVKIKLEKIPLEDFPKKLVHLLLLLQAGLTPILENSGSTGSS